MGILDVILGNKKNKNLKPGMVSSLANLFTPVFSESYDASLNDVYMSCVNTHAKNASKFKPMVYVGKELSSNPAHAYLNRLLSLRPNPMQSAAQFWERAAKLYFMENNVFIFLEWDFTKYKEPLSALWILDLEMNALEVKADENGEVYLSFNLNGRPYYTGMENIVHIARNAGPNILGESNPAIKKVLDIIQTNYQGIEQAIKSSAFIRYIVQSTTLLNDTVRKSRAQEFAETYLGNTSSGVVYLDSATNVIPVTANNKYANADEMKLFENKIYNYLNISEKILKSEANEDERQAYYELTMDPLAIKISQELTYKIFTPKEIGFKNQIMITADPLESASMKTKIAVATITQKLPTYKPNDINRLLGMPTTENGEKEFSTLNYVDANKQNQYQGVGKTEEQPKEEEPDGNTETDPGQKDKDKE